MIIGFTGGTGTGKSSACDFFRKNEYLIIDADKVSRDVCVKGSRCLEEISEAFGSRILDEEGNLKRRALGDIVFNDKSKLELLNTITHKHIRNEIIGIVSRNPQRNIVIDAPLLFEAGLDSICDLKVCVLSSKSKRTERIMLRDGLTEEQAIARVESQPDDEFYISKCDIVLFNNEDSQSLMEQMEKELGHGR